MVEKAMGTAEGAIGDRLEELEVRYRSWRESRRRGDHIPSPLWAAAVELARELGAARVANRLRLSKDFLNRRLGAAMQQPRPEAAEPEFVELLTAPAAPIPAAVGVQAVGVHDCVVELHNARGARMRVELNASGLAGLAHLCRAFWSAA